ncbi:MAG: polya polymerase, partial [Bacteroidaceae bacterium]|nr:polya polymerase [Bacteroidaceae bacterium]
LVTGEGDRLNLKSKLCQLVSLASIFSLDLANIPELELIAHEPEDAKKLLDFLVRQ